MGQNQSVKDSTVNIDVWKACIEVIKNNNNKRNACNIAFIGLAVSTFYIIYKHEVAMSLVFLVSIFVCSMGWILTIYSYRKANEKLYEAIMEIEHKLGIKVFSRRHTKNKFEQFYEYSFPILLSYIAIIFFIKENWIF